ncbi:SDR family oxidoreductase [Agrobacterium burrii]
MSDNRILSGKTAWILGGGSGLGAAAARSLGSLGAHVAVSGRRLDALERTVKQIRDNGGDASVIPVDVLERNQIDAAAEMIGSIDILVYSSGTNVPRRRLSELNGSDWDRIVDINLNGALHCLQSALPGMRLRRAGTVVMISSWAGWRMEPVAGAAYSSTKHALPALCETVNIEEGPNGIRATCLMPAEANTEVLDTRASPPHAEARARMLRADDVGSIIGYVASAPSGVCFNQIVMSPLQNNFYAPRTT